MTKRVKQRVELIRYTAHPEATIAAAAKLCYSSFPLDEIIDKQQEEDNAKFITMLVKMNHLSPFEHASFTFGIEGVSRALLAQITRHRLASFSVRSQRYVSESDFGYILPKSIETLGKASVKKFKEQMEQMSEWYKEWQTALGGKGEHSNEDARFVLPNAAETKMIVTMNARELMHFFQLRTCERAQWEIRDLSWEMLQLVLNVAPTLFSRSGPGCCNTGCKEGKKACGEPKLWIDRQKRAVESGFATYEKNKFYKTKKSKKSGKLNIADEITSATFGEQIDVFNFI